MAGPSWAGPRPNRRLAGNEAAFLLGEGNGMAGDAKLKDARQNHPREPVAFSRAIGLSHVVGQLDALYRERGEELWRPPLLSRRLALGEAGLGN